MPSRDDLTGKRFGRLVVQGLNPERRYKRVVWNCLCDCGKEKSTTAFLLKSGQTRSCGCLSSETTAKRNKIFKPCRTHGMSKTAEFRAWADLTSRCSNVHYKQYKDYGGRGIKVCQHWTGREGFINFLKDVGNKPSKEHTIDRIDNDGDYEPENCRWVLREDQNRNQRRNKKFMYNGKLLTVEEISRDLGVKSNSIHYHLNKKEDIYSIIAHFKGCFKGHRDG